METGISSVEEPSFENNMTYIKLCLIVLILLETGMQLYPLETLIPKNPNNTNELPVTEW